MITYDLNSVSGNLRQIEFCYHFWLDKIRTRFLVPKQNDMTLNSAPRALHLIFVLSFVSNVQKDQILSGIPQINYMCDLHKNLLIIFSLNPER